MEEEVFVCHLQYAADLRGRGARRSTDLADRYVVSDRLLHSIWSKSGWIALLLWSFRLGSLPYFSSSRGFL